MGVSGASDSVWLQCGKQRDNMEMPAGPDTVFCVLLTGSSLKAPVIRMRRLRME